MKQINARFHSFRFAFQGLITLFREEPNAWIHLLAAIVAITLGCLYELSTYEWILIAFCIGGVFALELLNSSLEALADVVEPERHPGIKKVKDLAAGAVLIGAMTALAVACFIFLPKILTL